VVGDFLWVREKQLVQYVVRDPRNGVAKAIRVIYIADGFESDWIDYPERLKGDPTEGRHLSYGGFRESSRTDLLRTSNRGSERVQEITPEDAISEGVMGRPLSEYSTQRGIGVTPDQTIAKTIFSELWNSIHGPDAWDKNEWVWPVEYEVVK